MLSEWENCKISNLSSEDFDKDGRETKKVFKEQPLWKFCKDLFLQMRMSRW